MTRTRRGMQRFTGWGFTCALVATAALGGCAQVQEPGTYAFRTEELLRDDCALLPEGDPDALWDGRVNVAGELVSIDYDLYGIELRGQVKADHEGFLVDGSASNVEQSVGGAPCQFEQVIVNVDAESESATAFTGTLRLRTEARGDERCECDLWARFRAERTGG